MKRSYAHSALVSLPRVNAHSALGLLRATLSAAEAAGKLPGPIEEARGEVQVAHDSLGEAIRERGIPAAESRDVRTLDVQLDNSWSAFFSWATGLAKLPPGAPESAKGTAILERVFPDGLRVAGANA